MDIAEPRKDGPAAARGGANGEGPELQSAIARGPVRLNWHLLRFRIASTLFTYTSYFLHEFPIIPLHPSLPTPLTPTIYPSDGG
jgi:hypothetical protein